LLILAYCCPCVVYGTLRSTFTQKPDDCVQDGAIFCVSAICCLAPALGAINRYEMREKYNIIGLHQSETAGVKKHFEGKTSNEVLGKKDGHGFITVYFPTQPCSLFIPFSAPVLSRLSFLVARAGSLVSRTGTLILFYFRFCFGTDTDGRT
jgi:hypothetical protein